jgi:hypothetical protein
MGLRDFFRKQWSKTGMSAHSPERTPPPSPALADDNPGVTKIEREHFLLHAPFQWVAVPGDNPLEFEFRNQTLREQLIVTVLLPRDPLDQGQRHQVAKDLAEKRLNGICTVSSGRSVHSSPEIKAGAGETEARCFGHDESQKVRFGFVIRATPAKVITVA